MFTGIIQAVGDVAAMQTSGGDMRSAYPHGKLHWRMWRWATASVPTASA